MNPPSVHVYTFCFNEQMMMPYFLRHYLPIADKITIYDNYSTDASIELAKQHEKIEVIQFDTNNQLRDDIHTEIRNNCWKNCEEDIAIVCDLDEFLYHPNLPRFLKRFMAKKYTVAKPIAYDMFSHDLPKTDGQIYDEIKIGARQPFYDKPILFVPAHIESMNFYPGGHHVLPEGQVKLYQNDLALKLLHFKFLSVDYVVARRRLGESRRSDINRQNKWGVEYEEKYEAEVLQRMNESLARGYEVLGERYNLHKETT